MKDMMELIGFLMIIAPILLFVGWAIKDATSILGFREMLRGAIIFVVLIVYVGAALYLMGLIK